MSGGNRDNVIIGKIFKLYDVSKDGYLSMDEFEKMLIKLEVSYNKKYLTSCFIKIDSDHSGYIE